MITKIERSLNYLLLHLQDGQLRLEPYSASVIRITYTSRTAFSQSLSRIVLPGAKKLVEWDVRETEKEVVLTTELELLEQKSINPGPVVPGR